MSELVKLPVPDPSDVLLSAMVGPVVVLQHTPLSVTLAPPSLEMAPPLTAADEVMDVTALVVASARSARLEKETSLP